MPTPIKLKIPALTVRVSVAALLASYRVLETVAETGQVWDAEYGGFLDLHPGEMRGIMELWHEANDHMEGFNALMKARE